MLTGKERCKHLSLHLLGKMSIGKKIFSAILNILIVFVLMLLILVIYSIIQINVFNKSYVNLFGYTALQVKTGSMEDTIHVNDIVVVKILKNKNEIKSNDIISYKEEDYIITHRVIEVTEDKIITKGDANNTEDNPITKDAVIGKVTKIVPNISIWIDVFKTKSVFSLAIITIILFIITFSIKTDEEKEDKKAKEEKVEESNEKKDEKKKKAIK